MKAKRIIVELIDPAGCRYYRRGQKFELTGGRKPEGFCDNGYLTVSKALKSLLDDNKLPGKANDRILVRCQPPHGAVWEVRLEDVAETERLDEEISKILGKL
jgi:uncharacterized repeat protein (TIGR04076 family)